MFAQLRDLSVLDATKEDILRQCAIHPRDPYVHLRQPKVQEVQAQSDQNTGKTKNVDIVEMIRSMGTVVNIMPRIQHMYKRCPLYMNMNITLWVETQCSTPQCMLRL